MNLVEQARRSPIAVDGAPNDLLFVRLHGHQGVRSDQHSWRSYCCSGGLTPETHDHDAQPDVNRTVLGAASPASATGYRARWASPRTVVSYETDSSFRTRACPAERACCAAAEVASR